ncbi:hypothetical protein [Aeromicrobium sp. 179-A 4D2 NHS]|uniref:hypothetical protein n=1 Tax=Aeromicrobium sp. 179-A 4D2 NHS TaxID=3142375 RepID=UPI0039A1B5B7
MSSPKPNAAVRAGESVVRRVRSVIDPMTTLPSQDGKGSGWLTVTVVGELEDIRDRGLPAPLASFGDRIEVRFSSAPADKGTEVRARLKDAPSSPPPARLAGKDAQAELRASLREAKQLIEVGEILRVDPVPHGERTSTPGGLLLEAWTRMAPKGGVR